jgi:hypothetical protein
MVTFLPLTIGGSSRRALWESPEPGVVSLKA